LRALHTARGRCQVWLEKDHFDPFSGEPLPTTQLFPNILARQLADETDEQAARFAAVFAIIAFIDIPIITMSVRWWRTLHPQPIVFDPFAAQALPDSMLLVLAIGMLAVGGLALWLIVLRAEAESLTQRAIGLRQRIDRREAR